MSATMTTAPLWTLLELVPALVFLLGVVPWVLLKAIQPRRRLSFDEEALLAKQEYDRYRQSFNYRLQSAGRSGYRFLSTKGMLAKIDRAFNIRAFGKALISTAIIAGMEHTAQNMLPGNVSMNLPGLFQQKSTQNGGNKEIDVAAGLKLTGKDKPKLQKSELWWTTKRLTQWSRHPKANQHRYHQNQKVSLRACSEGQLVRNKNGGDQRSPYPVSGLCGWMASLNETLVERYQPQRLD